MPFRSFLSYMHFEMRNIFMSWNLSIAFISFSTDSVPFQKPEIAWAQHAQKRAPIHPELD